MPSDCSKSAIGPAGLLLMLHCLRSRLETGGAASALSSAVYPPHHIFVFVTVMFEEAADAVLGVMSPPRVLINGTPRSGQPQFQDAELWVKCVLGRTLQRNFRGAVAVFCSKDGCAHGSSEPSGSSNVNIGALASKQCSLHSLGREQVLRCREADG